MPGADGNEDLLLETRKLLNELNAENAELKARNRALTQKVRDAEEATLEARRSERDLERDSKQLNFNLMQQVQLRTEEKKAAETREEQALLKARENARMLEACQERLSDVEARFRVAQEQIRLMEGKMDELRSEAGRSDADAQKSRQDLTSTINAERERLSSESKQWQSQLAGAREQIARLERRAVEGEAALDAAKGDLDVERDRHTLEVSRLRSAAQRTLDAEAETAFVHDQLLAIADQMAGEYDIYVEAVRAAIRGVQESDAAVSDAMHKLQTQRASVGVLRESDEHLHEILRKTADEARQTASDGKHTTDQLQMMLNEARREARSHQSRAEDLERRVASLEAELDVNRQRLAEANAILEEQNAISRSMKKELDGCQSSLVAARRDVSESEMTVAQLTERCRALEENMRAERAASQSKAAEVERKLQLLERERRTDASAAANRVAALADENEGLRRELQSHTQSLAAELHRLQGSLIAPPSRESSRSQHDPRGTWSTSSALRVPRMESREPSRERRSTSPTEFVLSPVHDSGRLNGRSDPPPVPSATPAAAHRDPVAARHAAENAAKSLAHKILSSVHLDEFH